MISSKKQRRSPIRWIVAAFVVPTALAVVLLAKDAVVVIDSINEAALQKEYASVERAIGMLGEMQAKALESHARRDRVFAYTGPDLNLSWLKENFTPRSMYGAGFAELAVVGPQDDVRFSLVTKGVPAPAQAHDVLAAADTSLIRARSLYANAYAKSRTAEERQMTGLQSVTDVVFFEGMPALVTAAPVVPASNDTPWAVDAVMLVGIQPLLGPQFAKLQSLAHVEGLMHVTADYAARPGRHVFVVKNAEGAPITYLSWIFTPPSHAVMRAALPALALTGALIFFMVAYAATLAHRITRQLAEREEAAVHAARHDAATGLANRGWFMSVFAEVLSSREHAGGSFAVLLIDCDHFKTTNDTLGHAAGDAVLRAVADRLRTLDDRLMIFSRLGGDEFAAVSMPLACSEDAAALLATVERTLSLPVAFRNRMINVGVSVGAAVLDAPSALSIDDWLVRADLALYRAKRDGRGCVRIYDPLIDKGDGGQSAYLRLSDGGRIESATAPALGEAA